MAPSYPRNWSYDVFPSFRGEDVRVTFLSHFLKELERKLITAFKDSEIQKSRSIDPELKNAIRDSRIAVVIFSRNYASSSWCLNELLEIVNCQAKFGQMVIPVFYGLDPSHVRKQTGYFGKVFEETCLKNTEEVKFQWKKALTNVANLLGYHSVTWGNEATMIEAIANDLLNKLLLTPSKDFENFVGIEDHISKMSELLDLESEEVKMIGIWGSSGIGKTTIARVLFNRLSRHFQGRIYIDRRFVAKSMDIYSKNNPDDYNMKLHLQEKFLCKILDRRMIEVDHLGAVKGKLKDMKVLIFIDDLDDQVVLDTLVGGDEWFGPRSRIIVVTKDKQILRGHGIECVYEVGLPSEELALQMFCQNAFRQNSPPDGFMELASEVADRAGRLPLGLNLLGSSMRGRNEKYWVDMLPTLRKGLDGKIQKALRVSYDGLERKEYKALFRYIACFFNGDEVDTIKLMLADSEMNVNIGLETLIDKSLIHVLPLHEKNIVEMHSLVEEMGKEIVRDQSDEPGEREFVTDSKDVCEVLEDNTGTRKVRGISLDIYKTDELQIHKEAFKKMSNLRFVNLYTRKWDHNKEVKWHLHEDFNIFPPKLRHLGFDGYPMRRMPSNFRPENLVKLRMEGSKLEKLWKGVHSLTGLKNMDLMESTNLKEIPNLSMAKNLETLNTAYCSSLVELPSSIQHLSKLKEIDMSFCENLEILPTGMDLESLEQLSLKGCSKLKSFPDISGNISVLNLSETVIEELLPNLRLQNLVELQLCGMKSEKLWENVQPLAPLMAMLSPSLMRLFLSDIPTLVELPLSFQNLNNLEWLSITQCINLKTLPNGINFKSLDLLDLTGCSRLTSFPEISTNISELHLNETGIEEVPRCIEKFTNLSVLSMWECKHLKHVSLNISKLKHLEKVDFSDCGALTEVNLHDTPSAVAMAIATDTTSVTRTNLDEASPSFQEYKYTPNMIMLNFANCFNLNQEAFLETQTVLQELILPGEEMPSYFTHQTSGTSSSSLTIPLFPSFLSRPFVRVRVCAVLMSTSCANGVDIHVNCRFKGISGNISESFSHRHRFWAAHNDSHLFIMDCRFPLNKDNAPSLAELDYDHVDIQLQVSNRFFQREVDEHHEYSTFKWGVRILNDHSSAESGLGDPNTLPHVNDECHETEQGEECGDSLMEIERRMERMQVSIKLIRFIIHITARRCRRNEILKVLERTLKKTRRLDQRILMKAKSSVDKRGLPFNEK
uniref:ADP-ribosyl cyclase/cyclic ADP-ribose hydrolase n=1 Tax=Noccaea caerulescens TaxID=107243 RepID=A0A1J3H866_NOCCA